MPNNVPVFITYRDRAAFLNRTITSYLERGFTDITIIDNGSERYPEDRKYWDTSTVRWVKADNEHRQLAPFLLDLVPHDAYYIVADCDIELDCPVDVCDVLVDALERYPDIPKIGLGIRVNDLLFPPPDRYAYSYLMEYSVERGTRYKEIGAAIRGGDAYRSPIIDAPIDTHFAMHRPGSGWPGIVGARTTYPYLCRHLPWYEPEYTEDERFYYSRVGKAWTMGHSAESLLETTIAVPFSELHAETVVALHGEQVRYAPCRVDTDYWTLLYDLWQAKQSFIVVEHDIVVNETTIDELRVCEHDWCAMPFPYRGEEKAYSLACTKFSAGLIGRYPKLLEIVGGMSDAFHPPGHWCRLDAWTYELLTRLGEKRHEHSWATPVGHLGPQRPKHPCVLEEVDE